MSVPAVPAPTRGELLDAEISRAAKAFRRAHDEAAQIPSEADHEAALALAELVLRRALRSAAEGYAGSLSAEMVERYARGPYAPRRTQQGEAAG